MGWEDNSAHSSVQDVSEENTSNWAREYSCPDRLPEAKLKSIRLISLVVISRQPNMDSVTWLLVIIIVQVYNEKEQAGQKEVQNVV